MKKLLFVLVFFSLWSCRQPRNQTLTIATAANMQFAMPKLVNAFTEQTGIPCEVIVSSSGKLTAQILAGAPFDVFVAADVSYPQQVYAKKKGLAPPQIYAYGQLVLWTTHQHLKPSMELLMSPQVKQIALPNPKLAPYGKAAEAVLMEYGIHQQVKSKLIFGESVAQTNQFITTQAVTIGFTAQSVVSAIPPNQQGKWLVLDATAYEPIAQAVVAIHHTDMQAEKAKRFISFLLSKEGKTILQEFGYKMLAQHE